MTQESWFQRIWRLITPELIYLGICYLVDTAAAAYLTFVMGGDYSVNDLETFAAALSDKLVTYAVLLQSVAAFFSILILLRMYFKDYRKRRFVFDKKSVRLPWYVILIPIGMLTALSGNLLINLSDLPEVSEGFEQSQQLLFSGPVIVQFVGIGIVIPICEELVYRGLIFMRMRQYCNVNLAIGISSLLFAMFHGNIVQGIYAFVTGILFAYVYEKFGSLKAPMLMHISANLLSLGLSVVNPSFDNRTLVFLSGLVAAAVCVLLIWFVDRHVAAERIYLEQAAGASQEHQTD